MTDSFQQEVFALWRAGLATHAIQDEVAIDKVYALAKVQDLPEVHFASVFPDGTILIGCKDGVPEPLVGMAQALSMKEDARAPSPAIDVVNAKLDALADQLNTIGDSQQAHVSSQVADIVTATANASERSVQDAVDQRRAWDDSQEAMRSEIAALRETMTRQLQQSASQQTTLSRNVVSELQSKIEELANQAPQTLDLGHLPDLSEKIASRQTQMQQTISNMAKDVATFCAIAAASETDPDVDPSTAILERIDDLAMAQADQHTKLATQVDGIAPKLATALAPLENLTTLQTDLADMQNRLRNLQEQVPPVIDLTEQRQLMVRFETAMANVLRRLENATTAMSSQQAALTQEDLQGLQALLTPLAGLPDQVDDLSTVLKSEMGSMERVMQTLDASRQEPAATPTLDLTEQRQSFAQFATALGQIIKRFETVGDNLTDTMDTFARAAPVDDKTHEPEVIATAQTPQIQFNSDALSIDALKMDFAELIATQFMQEFVAAPPPLTEES